MTRNLHKMVFRLRRDQRGAIGVGLLMIIPVLATILVMSYDRRELINTARWQQEALNRATKAAAWQITSHSYAIGAPQVDPVEAENKFREMLAENLRLDSLSLASRNYRIRGTPTYQLLVFNGPFPQFYANVEYGVNATINEPTVIALSKVDFNSIGAPLRQIKRWSLAKVVPAP